MAVWRAFEFLLPMGPNSLFQDSQLASIWNTLRAKNKHVSLRGHPRLNLGQF